MAMVSYFPLEGGRPSTMLGSGLQTFSAGPGHMGRREDEVIDDGKAW